MKERFNFRVPMFSDKGTFTEFQYLELGDTIECTLCGYNGEPQQCIGKKDKNEKLIYEGDIITDGSKTFIIKYCDNCVSFACFDETDCNSCHNYTWSDFVKNLNTIEVIGNIHQGLLMRR